MENKNDYKCPEIENLKRITEEFFKEANQFIEKYKKEEK